MGRIFDAVESITCLCWLLVLSHLYRVIVSCQLCVCVCVCAFVCVLNAGCSFKAVRLSTWDSCVCSARLVSSSCSVRATQSAFYSGPSFSRSRSLLMHTVCTGTNL